MDATANTIRLINELRPVEFLYLVINLSKASYPDVLQMRTAQMFVLSGAIQLIQSNLLYYSYLRVRVYLYCVLGTEFTSCFIHKEVTKFYEDKIKTVLIFSSVFSACLSSV